MAAMSLLSPTALSICVREVVDFVDDAGWDQPPQMFALVPTVELAEHEPELVGAFSEHSELTPIAQEPLPTTVEGGSPELDAALAGITWPASVAGCALVQEILILPPEAEAELDQVVEHALGGGTAAEQAALEHAAAHPQRQEARLVAAVLRGGEALCLLQLRPDAFDADAAPELLEHPELAPNLVAALLATLEE
ncbi:MAG: PPA1309 family protein [Actinomycetota bacterium]|nr:PPA1309 family protein [Actinomycetota bacterium]